MFHFADPLLQLCLLTQSLCWQDCELLSTPVENDPLQLLRRFRPQIGMCCSLQIKLQFCVHTAPNINYLRLRVIMLTPEELQM